MLVLVLGAIVTGTGILFLFLGSLGVFRMPDVYNRLQAGTKCTTLGAFLTIIGVGIMEPAWLAKTLVIGLFILITNPISNHALGRASRKSGVPLCDKTVVDKTGAFQEYEGEA
jgi:multicomponent Na+:H+ antiporter subunit G